ncbi:dopamine receptor D4a isoform 2-T2 [Menidia menidia]
MGTGPDPGAPPVPDPGALPGPGHARDLAALVLGVLLIVVIICGNVLVVVSVLAERALKTTTNYFIFQGGVWTFGTTVCDGLMTMDVMLCTASIFNLCAISIDRFIAVLIPLNYNRKHVDLRQAVLLSATWVLALAVASPVMFGVNDLPGRDPDQCKLESTDYVLYSSVCSFFIPCPVMVLLYCGMFRGLRRWEEARRAKLKNSIQACRKLQEAAMSLPPLASLPPPLPPVIENQEEEENQDQEEPSTVLSTDPNPPPKGPVVHTVSFAEVKYNPNPNPPRRKTAKINSRERKAMKVLPVVVGAFLFCWTPFFVLHILRARCQVCHIPPALMSAVTWLGYANSALNPVIYTIFNTEFRKFFKKFLHLP